MSGGPDNGCQMDVHVIISEGNQGTGHVSPSRDKQRVIWRST